jgi:NAD(P)H-hydrate epimerase
MAIGPGLGTGFAAQQVVMRVVSTQTSRPLVVDADALNCLALTPDVAHDFRASAVLTPHPLEYARLAKSLALQPDLATPPPQQRQAAAERLAQRMGAVVVLKGHGTVVSDGTRSWTCQRGNDALAIGGSGDVLTGVIAGFIAQWHRGGLSLFDCACLAVEAHARAAELWVAQSGSTAGMLATELAAAIPSVLPSLRAPH